MTNEKETIVCPKCKSEIKTSFKFCPNCGAEFEDAELDDDFNSGNGNRIKEIWKVLGQAVILSVVLILGLALGATVSPIILIIVIVGMIVVFIKRLVDPRALLAAAALFVCLGVVVFIATHNNPTINTTQASAMTPQEASDYKASCQQYDYPVLKKDAADSLKGKRILVTGLVIQATNLSDGSTFLLVQVDSAVLDDVAVFYPQKVDIYQNDSVTIWGEIGGNYSYKSEANWNVTDPQINAKFIEKASQ